MRQTQIMRRIGQSTWQGTPVAEVHLQDSDGHPADRCETNQEGSVPPKVALPLVATRVEKRDKFLRHLVYTGNARALVVIVCEASKAQIRGPRVCPPCFWAMI